MRLIAGIWASLSGRLAILLTLGMCAVASLSLAFAEQAHWQALVDLRMASVVSTADDVSMRLGAMPQTYPGLLAAGVIRDIRPAAAQATIDRPERRITTLLRERLGAGASGQIEPHALCFPPGSPARRPVAVAVGDGIPDCWLIRFADPRGVPRSVLIGLPHYLSARQRIIDPLYLAIIVVMSATVASVVTLLTMRPLRQLTRATEAFSLLDEPALLPETGPREVRNAIATFNLMQQRVSEGHRERTGMLAAISHDLQTPLTRLRLRLDDVDDATLRARLGADLAIMQSIVREGLELARSSDSSEPWSAVDVDSLLASIVADAVEMGAEVEIGRTCGLTIQTRVDGLTRCISNLMENALKYGGCARIDCHAGAHGLDIQITDEGPGIDPAEIERMFEPFARGEYSRSRATGGTGLGLTIAKAQSRLLNGDVVLENRDGGGLVATVKIVFPAGEALDRV